MQELTVKTYPNPVLPAKEILRYAGQAGDTLPPDAEACLAALPPAVCGRAVYTVYYIRQTENGLDLGFAHTSSSDLERNLEGCDKIILFAATAGVEFDRLVQKYRAFSPARALWYQAIGAAYAESVCDALCADLQEVFGPLKPRFSPGYGDLPLTLQTDIFAALQCEKHIGVTLNEHLFMTPSKSVTAIVGVGGRNT